MTLFHRKKPAMRLVRAMQRKSRGFTLPELLVAAGVTAAFALVTSSGFKVWNRQLDATGLAGSVSPVFLATQNYVNANWQQLQTSTPTISGFANPLAPTVAELQAAGNLPAAYIQGSNLIHANAKVRIWRTPLGCIPVNCDVAYTAYLDAPALDSAGHPNIELVSLAAKNISGYGGFSTNASAGVFTAPDGSWTALNPTGQAAVLAAYGTLNSSGNAAFVRVGDNRDPNLQAGLTVAGTMKAGNVNSTGTVTSTGNVTTSGSVAASGNVTASGSMATSGNLSTGGQIVSNGQVVSYSGVTAYGPMATTSSLTAGTITANSGIVKIAPAAYAGWSCSSTGTGGVTTDPYGKVLSCQSGVWQDASAADSPSGTLCGSSYDGPNTTQGTLYNRITTYCKGYSPDYGCPAGYSWVQTNPMFNAVACAKN